MLPTTILYDERGLDLYDEITTLAGEYYYLFPCEENILKESRKDIVDVMCRGAAASKGGVVLELGSGSLRKTAHLLSALSTQLEPNVPSQFSYFALDLAPISITHSLESLAPVLRGNIALRGLCTDYDSGLQWVRNGGLERQRVSSSDVVNSGADRGRPEKSHLKWVKKTEEAMSSTSGAGVGKHQATTAILPEEGERIPNPLPPPTPPSSKSRAPPDDPTNGIPLHLLFLGSSLGNFARPEAAEFLRSLPLRPGSRDTLLLGLDGRNEKSLVETAYDDPKGYTRRFIMNGLAAAGSAIGVPDLETRFEYCARFDVVHGRHEAYYRARSKMEIAVPASAALEGAVGQSASLNFEEGELVNIEYSYKYSDADAYALFAGANLRPITRWQDPKGLYNLWLLERPAFHFPLLKHPEADNGLSDGILEDVRGDGSYSNALAMPSLAEWYDSWKLWDTVTLGMIPPSMLLEKPIDLRHKCLFYLGHIPAFLDIHLSRLLEEPHSEPEHFKDIFERGIDPHVDDPSQIHPHSEVPEAEADWPSLAAILDYRDRVRARVISLYNTLEANDEKAVSLGRRVGRVLWMCLEHEGWHAETLLYMLIQRAGTPGGTIPPPGFAPPSWLSHPSWNPSSSTSSARSVITIPPTTFSIGHDDKESDDASSSIQSNATHEFGWDNEHPQRNVLLDRAVRIKSRCVSNGEYLNFLGEAGQGRVPPASWVAQGGGEYQVRTLYGPVPFTTATNWPLVSSYDDLAAYAKSKGGRIPTEHELRLFIDRHLGAESGNIGFRNWSFVEPVDPQPERGIKGHNGGAWEWSSSVMDTHEGYIPSAIYPGYSSDFFDGLHHIVLGGSFATVPRIAQRRSVRNYYQHNYPYAWVAGRVAYDA